MTSEGDVHFQRKPLEEISVTVAMKNLVSHSEVPRNAPSAARLAQFLDNGVTLDIPPRFCAEGHHLQLSFVLQAGWQKLEFVTTAVVKSMERGTGEDASSRRDSIEVEFRQFDQKSWDGFLGTFAAKQQEILAILDGFKD